MTKPVQDNIPQMVDEILSQMPLEEKISLVNMKKEDVDALQGAFDIGCTQYHYRRIMFTHRRYQ
jgi:hypothetical protein